MGLLGGYAAIMIFAPFPGATEHRWSMESNAARFVDGILLEGHMWRQTKAWDTEGALSTLPAIATMLCGISATRYLVSGILLALDGL